MVLIKLVNGTAQGIFLTQPWILTAALSNMPNFLAKLNQMCIHQLDWEYVHWNMDLSWILMGTVWGERRYKKPYVILIVLGHGQTYRQ